MIYGCSGSIVDALKNPYYLLMLTGLMVPQKYGRIASYIPYRAFRGVPELTCGG